MNENQSGRGLLAALSMTGLFEFPAPRKIRGEAMTSETALREEYERIQRKESKLSRADRDRVINRYERFMEAKRAQPV